MSNLDTERESLKAKRKELQAQEDALRELYDDEARKICPFDSGDEIEYEPGKKGVVDRVFFPCTAWIPLEDQAPDRWAVTGRKINKDGKFGKKGFQVVSGDSHIVEGKVCRKKNLDDIFS